MENRKKLSNEQEQVLKRYFNIGYELNRIRPDMCEMLLGRLKEKYPGHAKIFLAGMQQWENVDMAKSKSQRKEGRHLDSDYPELDHDEPDVDI